LIEWQTERQVYHAVVQNSFGNEFSHKIEFGFDFVLVRGPEIKKECLDIKFKYRISE
jgi:hypothetical protein